MRTLVHTCVPAVCRWKLPTVPSASASSQQHQRGEERRILNDESRRRGSARSPAPMDDAADKSASNSFLTPLNLNSNHNLGSFQSARSASPGAYSPADKKNTPGIKLVD